MKELWLCAQAKRGGSALAVGQNLEGVENVDKEIEGDLAKKGLRSVLDWYLQRNSTLQQRD